MRAHEWANKVEQPGGVTFSGESAEDQKDDGHNKEEEKKKDEEELEDKKSDGEEKEKERDLRSVEVKSS